MTATVELTEAELADLRELTHATDAQSAVRCALDEYRRYARRMLLKELSGQIAIAERAARVDWPKVDGILARIPTAPPMKDDEK